MRSEVTAGLRPPLDRRVGRRRLAPHPWRGSRRDRRPSRAGPLGASGTTLRALLDSVVAAGVPGVLERTQDGRRVISATAGVADLGTGAPLRPDARFRVGSITKTFVASVVL
ncbi:serine hydrolase [Streptomyces sp. NPDC006739]|uniref:serine hydrolase n=1 Tax=Streptomyces sp. NPDC006739 TaxID=3364763 RepID=UPI0036ABCC92